VKYEKAGVRTPCDFLGHLTLAVACELQSSEAFGCLRHGGCALPYELQGFPCGAPFRAIVFREIADKTSPCTTTSHGSGVGPPCRADRCRRIRRCPSRDQEPSHCPSLYSHHLPYAPRCRAGGLPPKGLPGPRCPLCNATGRGDREGPARFTDPIEPMYRANMRQNSARSFEARGAIVWREPRPRLNVSRGARGE
jgi:hypothetical protein